MTIVNLVSLDRLAVLRLESKLPLPCWISIAGYNDSALVFPDCYEQGIITTYKYNYVGWRADGYLKETGSQGKKWGFSLEPSRIWLDSKEIPTLENWRPWQILEDLGKEWDF